MKKKVLVTGSAGFIFSNFIRWAIRYHKDDFEFVSIDKIARPEGMHNVYANRGHKLYIGDVCDRHFVDVVFQLERPDIVIHAAAESHVDDSIAKADNFVMSNILGTQVIIDKCREYNVGRLCYISTDEVYGQLLEENAPAWKESAGLHPRNPYSASKASGELLVKAAYETHGLQYNITRSCNNFGPRQSPNKLIPKILKCIMEEKPIPIYGQGAQIREWIHVADNCSAIMSILNGPANETYNISSNYEMSNLELVNMICNIMDGGHSLITFVEDRAGHDFRYSVDNSKLKALGWKSNFKFKNGLQHTCKWYSNNRWFLR